MPFTAGVLHRATADQPTRTRGANINVSIGHQEQTGCFGNADIRIRSINIPDNRFGCLCCIVILSNFRTGIYLFSIDIEATDFEVVRRLEVEYNNLILKLFNIQVTIYDNICQIICIDIDCCAVIKCSCIDYSIVSVRDNRCKCDLGGHCVRYRLRIRNNRTNNVSINIICIHFNNIQQILCCVVMDHVRRSGENSCRLPCGGIQAKHIATDHFTHIERT